MPTDAEIDSLYKRADEAFQKHNYDYARDLFQQILLFKPDHEKAHEALRVSLIRKFQEQGATSKIKLMAIKGKIEVQLKATKDPQKRMEICLKFLNDDPTNAKVRAILAESLLILGHSNGAAAEGRMALQDEPTNVIALKTLVQAYRNTSKVKEAAVRPGPRLDAREGRPRPRAAPARPGGHADHERRLQLGQRRRLPKGPEELRPGRGARKADEAGPVGRRFPEAPGSSQQEMDDAPTDAKLPKKVGDLYFEKKKDYGRPATGTRRPPSSRPRTPSCATRSTTASLRISS